MEITTVLQVFIGSVILTFFTLLTVHFNGKTILGLIDVLAHNFYRSNSKTNWRSTASEAEVILLGLLPVAIASLVSTSGGTCRNSIISFLVTEAIVVCLFLFIPQQFKKNSNFSNKQFYRSHWRFFIIVVVWCLAFSTWAYLAIDPTANHGADPLLVNGNGDMWFYIRRFAAYTVDNLSFDNEPACYYLQISPKKLSSFIGSIIVYLSPDTVFGITLFQGLLGCSLFLSLFGNWVDFNYQGKSLSRIGTVGAVIWALASPAVFWLLISSYLSNALFVIIFILGLTAARCIALNSDCYPNYAGFIILFSFIVNIFSFYLVLLPIALIFYTATVFIYSCKPPWKFERISKNLAIIMLSAGTSILLCCLVFNHQINLAEVTDNLNTLKEHGKNFVPLNPWSLVQEKPNPMPNIKDFGVWFNIVVGVVFAGFVLRIIYRNLLAIKNADKSNDIYVKDLISAGLVVGVYALYLLAYIPLEYTYRLGKFAVSILHPLATVATLPTILWFRDRFNYQKSRNFKLISLVLLVLHIILHIDKTLYLGAQPIGRYHLIPTKNTLEVDDLTIIGCAGSTSSQKYEKLLGLDLAKDYSNLAINVITNPNLMNSFPVTDVTVRGANTIGEKTNLCIFEFEL